MPSAFRAKKSDPPIWKIIRNLGESPDQQILPLYGLKGSRVDNHLLLRTREWLHRKFAPVADNLNLCAISDDLRNEFFAKHLNDIDAP